ncbi:MAG: glycosyl transferase family 2 [Flavobacteriaceae bacterium]|nr:glycosyl transferase family 2 [Flavobacteriaceae bacterium]
MKNTGNNSYLVSVIMNCHNGEKYLKHSLRSVLKQSYKNWELIFYDNLSTDKSKSIVQKKIKIDKRIKYFKSKQFLNLYEARNRAIDKSKGNYICFLDTDDFWDKNKLKVQIDYIKKFKCEILYSKFFILNEIKKKKYLNEKKKLSSGFLTQDFLNNYSLGILTVILKKSVFSKIIFNKRYNIIGDFDFFIKASILYKIHAINKPLATYRHHAENLSNKKIDLNLKEFLYWQKKNRSKLKKFKLNNLKWKIFKLELKKFIKNFIIK